MTIDALTEKIIGCAIEVHRWIGPGLLESVYEECLATEFDINSIKYERQKNVPLIYKGKQLNTHYRLDFLVENQVPLELKSTSEVHPASYLQLLTYLRILDRKVGLLINFSVPILKDGIKRIANKYDNTLQNKS